jgi:hypothetical protein
MIPYTAGPELRVAISPASSLPLGPRVVCYDFPLN